MPGYVIHLSIAEEYLKKHDKKENYSEFIEGVIFPDSVTDKSLTHYGKGSSESNLVEFLNNNLISNSFYRGYFLHLLTDYLFYNKCIPFFSKDIYNDYDILNKELIKKYDVKLPNKVKNKVYRRYKNCKATVRLWSRDKYKVSYNGNGGSVNQSEKEFYDGDNFTFPSASRKGYTLNGWYDNKHQMWSNTGWVVCGENYVETAQWTANQYNVFFDDNGADSGNVSDSTATYDSNFTLPESGYKKKGYKFLGWSTDKNATSPQHTAGQTFTYRTDGDTVFYAVWAKSDFEVKFHGNGSSAADYTADLTYNKSVSLPKNVFERPGYTFIGWVEDPTRDTVQPDYTDGQAVKDLCEPGETYHLYAIWKKSDGSFETKNIIHDDKMFLGDVNLTGQNGTGYSNANIDSKSAHIDKEDDPGYFTDRYGSNNN